MPQSRRRRLIWFLAGAAVVACGTFALSNSSEHRVVLIGGAVSAWNLVFILGSYVAAGRCSTWVRRQNYRVCPGCGYLLHGLPDIGRCPECSEPYELTQLRIMWLNYVLW